MRTSRRNHRGCLFLVFHGNVVWICSVSWSGLFSVTVLMSHNYSVLKCLCLVFFFFFTMSETDQSETRDWAQGPGVDATVSEKPESGKFKMKSQKEETDGRWRSATVHHLSAFRFQPTAWWWFPTSHSGTVSAAEMQTPRCEYELKDLLRFLQVSSVWLGGDGQSVCGELLLSQLKRMLTL